MTLLTRRSWSGMMTTSLLLLSCAGCAYKVVRPPPLVVGSAQTGDIRVVKYPTYILTHDSEDFWDAHQIKDNFIGLSEGEIVRWMDIATDKLTPGPEHRHLKNGIESIKNSYAQLPDCAPVRIVDGLFSALGLEKITIVGGASKIVWAPTDPSSYVAYLRVVYLTDWIQETLGEVNTAGGYLVPWPGPFVPRVATAPLNIGADWLQDGAVEIYIYGFHEINIGLDHALDGYETAWGGVVWLFVQK